MTTTLPTTNYKFVLLSSDPSLLKEKNLAILPCTHSDITKKKTIYQISIPTQFAYQQQFHQYFTQFSFKLKKKYKALEIKNFKTFKFHKGFLRNTFRCKKTYLEDKLQNF